MSEYLNSGKELLRMLINNGYEAYFIGDVVRNSILEKEITRIDITTIAGNEAIKYVFKNCEIIDDDKGSVCVVYNNYYFYIHTFMVSDGLDNNTLLNKHYSKNLLDDLANRDFTINAIAMSHSGKLTDAYNGFNDIMKKRIVHIGNAKIRFSKDPSLMIKAFALVSDLNYDIVSKTRKAIAKRRKNLDNVPIGSYYSYLTRVFEGKYAKKAIQSMERTNIERTIPSLKWVINRLANHYRKVTMEEALLMSFVHSGTIDDRYQPYIKNFTSFVNIFTLACANKKAKYDAMTLFGNGLDIVLEANRINYLLGKARNKERKIKKQWEALPIKRVCDLAYKGQDIIKIIKPEDQPKIRDVIDEVILAILNGELINDYDDIEKEVLKILTRENIYYNLNGFEQVISQNESFEKEEIQEIKSDDYTNYRLDQLEQKLEQQAKLLEERNNQFNDMRYLRMKNDISLLASQSIEFINSSENLQYVINNQNQFKKDLEDFVFKYIQNEEKNENN